MFPHSKDGQPQLLKSDTACALCQEFTPKARLLFLGSAPSGHAGLTQCSLKVFVNAHRTPASNRRGYKVHSQ